jgi:hypothetical protein
MLAPAVSRPLIDLSDNLAREAALEALLRAVAAGAPPAPVPWTVPGDDAPHEAPGGSTAHQWAHLNSLRVAHQFVKNLGEMCAASPFLLGAPSTCVLGLEWLAALVGPLGPVDDKARAQIAATVEQFREGRGIATTGEALFEAHRHLLCPDRDLTRLLLREHLGPCEQCREFDVDVCAWMAASPDCTYASWLHGFPRWRESGLFFPLVIAAQRMPTLAHWLPEEVHSTPLAHCFARCLATVASPATCSPADLDALPAAWLADRSGAAYLLAGTLDRIAVLLRVKSNGRAADPRDMRLDPALAAFPASFGDSMHEANHAAWTALPAAIEDALPPSLLLAPLVRPRHPTWGFAALTLCVEDGAPRTIRFAESRLGIVHPALESEIHTHTPCFARDCMYHQTSHRVQDVLCRLGEILTSPDVALGMLHPTAVAAAIRGGTGVCTAVAAACSDRARVLASMSSGASALSDYVGFARALESAAPPVATEHYAAPLALLFWRVDIPPRAVVFVGDAADMDPASQSQHHLPKLLLNSKIPQRAVGGSGLCPVGATEHDLRGVLRAFAASDLRGHPCNLALARVEPHEATPQVARQTTPVVTTTLAESLACFALAPPSHLNTCQVGRSAPWTQDGIDPRYAEKQLADNGFRFRDWVAMHVGRGGTQQSRLAAHVLSFDALHVTKMPWVRGGEVRWVRVASTVCPQSRTLQGPTLRQAVENRFFHDPRMLPVRAQGDTVAKADVEVYSEGDARAFVVYSPVGSARLEMVAFQLAAPDCAMDES